MALRDKLKRGKLLDRYKKQRNKVSTQVHTAKKNYFDKLVTDNRHTATIWRVVNEIIRKPRPQTNNFASNVTSDFWNKHFLSLAGKKSVSSLTPMKKVHAHRLLKNFARANFKILRLFVIYRLQYTKLVNPFENLRNQWVRIMFQLALPYIVYSLTYM